MKLPSPTTQTPKSSPTFPHTNEGGLLCMPTLL
jgi:hypothetical protein